MVGAEEDARLSDRVPWRKDEETTGGRETVDIILTETFRHHTKCLQHKNKNILSN